jgi:hypothetical protein
MQYAQKSNKAEDLINIIAEDNGVDVQRGLAGGSTDARPFSEYNLTPNIITLNVPNRFKHNANSKGEVVSEMVKKSHADDLFVLLKKLTTLELDYEDIAHNNLSLSLKYKRNGRAASVQSNPLMEEKALLNERLYWC